MTRLRGGPLTFVLVGNKCDKHHEREVSYAEGEAQATIWGCPFFETSAKTAHNVEEVFATVIRALRRSDASKVGPPGASRAAPLRSVRSRCIMA
jgi:GTPase KRas protein